MPSLLWEDVRRSFEPDGSLIDAYVFDTTAVDWQQFIDLVRSCGWPFEYTAGGEPVDLPERVEDIFSRRNDDAVLLQITPDPDVHINAHFFSPDEIEVDFAPEELQGQARLDVLCDFIAEVGQRLGQRVVVTPENGRTHPLIEYDVMANRIRRL
ncbi:MAG: hypothetical protein JWO79_1934 [Actinomycetia bacterium]|nr:hypothetical protein [Actinomycetes bacterium]